VKTKQLRFYQSKASGRTVFFFAHLDIVRGEESFTLWSVFLVANLFHRSLTVALLCMYLTKQRGKIVDRLNIPSLLIGRWYPVSDIRCPELLMRLLNKPKSRSSPLHRMVESYFCNIYFSIGC
jgi:hypothetical protein